MFVKQPTKKVNESSPDVSNKKNKDGDEAKSPIEKETKPVKL